MCVPLKLEGYLHYCFHAHAHAHVLTCMQASMSAAKQTRVYSADTPFSAFNSTAQLMTPPTHTHTH